MEWVCVSPAPRGRPEARFAGKPRKRGWGIRFAMPAPKAWACHPVDSRLRVIVRGAYHRLKSGGKQKNCPA